MKAGGYRYKTLPDKRRNDGLSGSCGVRTQHKQQQRLLHQGDQPRTALRDF